ncbi:MAG TPA: autotransporter-associated beta strand repeat-containing protein, partial [Phycisphaerae bacterium]|nr:autotransporter-associated beta strand repeat-containing protein [Phycisphaerae bacterium]
NEVSGIMSGDGGVTKSGDSTWKLSGNNTYTGATTISDGTLLVTGTTSGQGDFGFGTLSADATLGGTGTIGLAADKNLTVVGVSDDAKAIVAPGASVGTLNVSTSGTGTTTFGDYSVLSIELTDDTVDLLSVGALDLSSTLDTLQLTVTGTQTQMRYVFVQYTGSLNSETFDLSDFSGLPVGASIDYGTAGEIAVVLIPEPATLTLLGLGACGVLLRRRRNR